jgi:hypothetical protein
MKKRIVLLTVLAAMMAAAMALSGVAQAKPTIEDPADAKCLAEAAKTLGKGFNPSNYTFHGGTVGEDNFTFEGSADGSDVYCGFGSNDQIDTLNVGDIFLGGAGNDTVTFNYGTFNGGEGDDSVLINTSTLNGGFNGGAGDDSVVHNFGTFNGGDGTDTVTDNQGTIINVP